MIEGGLVAWLQSLDAAVLAMAKTLLPEQRDTFLHHLGKLIENGPVKGRIYELWKTELHGNEGAEAVKSYHDRRNAILLTEELNKDP